MNLTKHQCPCCEYWTLDGEQRRYSVCPVCYWEDDPLQFDNMDMDFGANGISLREARETYQKIGACSEEYIELVRTPKTDENYINES